jgi:hypothetical protein
MTEQHVMRVVLQLPGKPPLTAEAKVSDLVLRQDTTTLVSVQVGTGPAYGGVTLPLDVLSALMQKVMSAAPPAVIMPDKKIITG